MRVIYIASVFFLLSSLCYSAEIPKKKLTVFTANVSDTRYQGDLLDKGKKLDDTVSVKVSAIIFAKPLKIKDVRKTGDSYTPEINALISYMKANVEGSPKQMASFWAPSEQKEKLQDMNNPEFFNKNRAYHEENPGLIILGIISQDKTTSVLITEPEPMPFLPVMAITFIKIDDKLYMTDHPSNDLELAIIEASFKKKDSSDKNRE